MGYICVCARARVFVRVCVCACVCGVGVCGSGGKVRVGGEGWAEPACTQALAAPPVRRSKPSSFLRAARADCQSRHSGVTSASHRRRARGWRPGGVGRRVRGRHPLGDDPLAAGAPPVRGSARRRRNLSMPPATQEKKSESEKMPVWRKRRGGSKKERSGVGVGGKDGASAIGGGNALLTHGRDTRCARKTLLVDLWTQELVETNSVKTNSVKNETLTCLRRWTTSCCGSCVSAGLMRVSLWKSLAGASRDGLTSTRSVPFSAPSSAPAPRVAKRAASAMGRIVGRPSVARSASAAARAHAGADRNAGLNASISPRARARARASDACESRTAG